MEPSDVALYLKIGPAMYRLDRLGELADHLGWTLTKAHDLIYTVHKDRHGVHCTCPDYQWRHQNTPEPCKHAKAIVEMGLL